MSDRSEIDSLCQSYVEGSMTEVEASRLQTLLLIDPTLHAHLLIELRLNTQLRGLHADAGSNSGIDKPHFLFPTKIFGATIFDSARQPISILLVIAASFVAVAFSWTWISKTWISDKPMVRLAATSGEVSIERAGQKLLVTQVVDLQVGDSLRTETGAGAQIIFRGERTRLELAGDTQLVVHQMEFGKRFELRRGSVTADIATQSGDRPLRLITSDAIATVTGTRLTLAARRGATWLHVDEGSVQLTRIAEDDSETAVVHSGEYAVASPGVEMQSRIATGPLDELSVPMALTLESGIGTGFGSWTSVDGGVRQTEVARIPDERPMGDGWFDPSKPNLFSFYYLPISTSSDLRLEALIELENVTDELVDDLHLNLWRFGLGLRFPDREINLRHSQRLDRGTLQMRMHIPEPQHFQNVPFSGNPDASFTAKVGASYRIKWEIRRVSTTKLHMRGKLWSVDSTEPIDWTVDATVDNVKGKLGAVTLETYRAACSFREIRAELLP